MNGGEEPPSVDERGEAAATSSTMVASKVIVKDNAKECVQEAANGGEQNLVDKVDVVSTKQGSSVDATAPAVGELASASYWLTEVRASCCLLGNRCLLI